MQGRAPKIKRAGRGSQRPKQPGAQQGVGRRVALRALAVLEQLAAGGAGGGDWEAARQLAAALLPLLPGAGTSTATGGQRCGPPPVPRLSGARAVLPVSIALGRVAGGMQMFAASEQAGSGGFEGVLWADLGLLRIGSLFFFVFLFFFLKLVLNLYRPIIHPAYT